VRQRPDSQWVNAMAARMRELLQQRCALPREDLEYVVEAVAKLRDERLKACIAELIGWGDDERAEVETFVAIAIEVLRTTNVSKLRDAAATVELRHWVRAPKHEEVMR
jgi:hypothetical protein